MKKSSTSGDGIGLIPIKEKANNSNAKPINIIALLN
jgi:hypothetical protein